MNVPHVIEIALLLLVAYLIGCVVGYLARRVFAPGRAPVAEAPAPEERPAPPLPQRDTTEIAARPARSGTISGAMAGAAAAAGASEIAAQAADPDATLKMEEAGPGAEPAPEPEPVAVPEGEGAEDIGGLAAMDGADLDSADLESADLESAEPAAEEELLDSTAEADASVGALNRPAGLAAPRDDIKDDLQRIKGIGPKLERTLNDLGVFHFDQIASWTRGNIDWVDTFLSFRGRIDREEWVAQARAFTRQGEEQAPIETESEGEGGWGGPDADMDGGDPGVENGDGSS